VSVRLHTVWCTRQEWSTSETMSRPPTQMFLTLRGIRPPHKRLTWVQRCTRHTLALCFRKCLPQCIMTTLNSLNHAVMKLAMAGMSQVPRQSSQLSQRCTTQHSKTSFWHSRIRSDVWNRTYYRRQRHHLYSATAANPMWELTKITAERVFRRIIQAERTGELSQTASSIRINSRSPKVKLSSNHHL